MVDIDECQTPTLCGSGGECHNIDGSYSCSCLNGYILQDNICIGKYSLCVNSHGILYIHVLIILRFE